MRWYTVLAAVALLGTVGWACSRSQPVPAMPTPRPVLSSQASVTPYNALVVDIDVALSAPSMVYVEYENPKAGRFRTRTTESAGTDHKISLVRLRSSTTYSYEVFVIDERGHGIGSSRGTFRTGVLPPGLRQAVTVVQGRPTYPLTLKDQVVAGFQGMVMLDSRGYIVWYYESPQGPPTAIFQKPNGNLLYILNPLGLREITPLGEEVDRLDEYCIRSSPQGRIHHDVVLIPENKVLYLSSEIHDGVFGAEVRPQTSDSIMVWDQDTGATRKLFDIFDFIPVTDRTSDSENDWGFFWRGCPKVAGVQDWTHSNSLFVGRRGNLILSIRQLDQIVSIAPDFQSLEWRLGGPGSDFTFPNLSDRFYRQHAAKELPSGNILLFDNGNSRPENEGGEYSRALELQLDLKDMTATKVWDYRHNADDYSDCCSNVVRLLNGDTVVLFPDLTTEDPCCLVSTLVEVDPSGKPIFQIQMNSPGAFPQYRIYPVYSIDGEIEIPQPER